MVILNYSVYKFTRTCCLDPPAAPAQIVRQQAFLLWRNVQPGFTALSSCTCATRTRVTSITLWSIIRPCTSTAKKALLLWLIFLPIFSCLPSVPAQGVHMRQWLFLWLVFQPIFNCLPTTQISHVCKYYFCGWFSDPFSVVSPAAPAQMVNLCATSIRFIN